MRPQVGGRSGPSVFISKGWRTCDASCSQLLNILVNNGQKVQKQSSAFPVALLASDSCFMLLSDVLSFCHDAPKLIKQADEF